MEPELQNATLGGLGVFQHKLDMTEKEETGDFCIRKMTWNPIDPRRRAWPAHELFLFSFIAIFTTLSDRKFRS